VRLRLAHHVIVIERLAPRADEEGRAEERRRAGADFGDGRDRGREGGRVEEDFLVESVGSVRGFSEGWEGGGVYLGWRVAIVVVVVVVVGGMGGCGGS